MVSDEVSVQEVEIVNPQGLHARPASLLVRRAVEFDAVVTLTVGEQHADCSSIMEVMMLAAPHGSRVTIGASGPQAEAAVAAIVGLVESGFGEVYG